MYNLKIKKENYNNIKQVLFNSGLNDFTIDKSLDFKGLWILTVYYTYKQKLEALKLLVEIDRTQNPKEFL